MKIAVSMTATLLLIVASNAAVAETEAERQACEPDAYKVCDREIPDADKVYACLKKNIKVLSADCRAVISGRPLPSRAKGDNGRGTAHN